MEIILKDFCKKLFLLTQVAVYTFLFWNSLDKYEVFRVVERKQVIYDWEQKQYPFLREEDI